MEKIIKIGEREVRLNNNMAWTMEYKDQFGKDILPVMLPLIASIMEGIASVVSEAGKDGEITVSNLAEAIEGRSIDILLPLFQADFTDIVINVVWAMAKAADERIDPPKKWIRQFDEGFYLDEVVPEVFDLVIKGFVSSKNRARLEEIRESLKALRPTI